MRKLRCITGSNILQRFFSLTMLCANSRLLKLEICYLEMATFRCGNITIPPSASLKTTFNRHIRSSLENRYSGTPLLTNTSLKRTVTLPLWTVSAPQFSLPLKGQNESFWHFFICSCSNIVNYALYNFAKFEKRNRPVNDSN